MQIRNHRIDDIWYRQSTNLSRGTITPTYLVMHYTTGWSGPGSRDWLLGRAGGSANRSSSAHLVIDRDGTAWQIAPFNRRAWHAGPSRHGSVSDLNSHAVGFEFVNPGFLRTEGSGRWVDDYGHRRSTQQLEEFGGFVLGGHPRIGSGEFAWPLYTEAQIATALALARSLVARYPIRGILGHEEIDIRGWKTDPGPAFPARSFAALVETDGSEADLWTVTATRLFLRGGPGTEHEPIDPPRTLTRDTVVERRSTEGGWTFVEVIDPGPGLDAQHRGVRGWVSTRYLQQG